jgi:hypothetical protein
LSNLSSIPLRSTERQYRTFLGVVPIKGTGKLGSYSSTPHPLLSWPLILQALLIVRKKLSGAV